MPIISYKTVIEKSLADVGYQGSTYDSKFSRFLDSIDWYNGKKSGACTWCCIANDYFVAISKPDDMSYEQARQIVCEPTNHAYNVGAGAKEKAQLYRSAGRWIPASDVKNATTGDEIFFYKSSGSEIGHVGRIYDWDSKYLYTVEGSTTYNGKAHSFGKKSYPFKSSRIAGFGRPDWYKYEDSAPAPKPTPEPTPTIAIYKVATNGGILRLRSAPNTSSACLACIPNGTYINVDVIVKGEPINYNTDWAHTTYGGYSGYVSVRWLKKQ